MWIYLLLAAGFGVWYYETHKPATSGSAAKPGMGAGPALDPAMSEAQRAALVAMVMAQTDPAELDKAAGLLDAAPPPGPYPIAAAWVRDMAKALRSKQLSSQDGEATLGAPAGHTPVVMPSHGGGARPAVNMPHPTLSVLNALAGMRKPFFTMAPFALRGEQLATLAWNQLKNFGNPQVFLDNPDGFAGFDPVSKASITKWRNLLIVGMIEALPPNDPATGYWWMKTAENPYFSKGQPGSVALGLG